MERLSAGDPRSIGGFRLLGTLGEGGMGRVYLARSKRGRTVAVKVVKGELARQPDFRRRFAQEITAARRVGEAWTAPVLEADTEAETPWVATGYIAGPSLAQVVDEQYGPLPAKSVSALASGLVRALRDIHNAGLVHRDLKPSNILITIDGPRVIDFGIARALDSAVQSAGGLTSTGALVGSPGFMSPEQVRGQQVTPASDIFCLGAVLAYAATGRMPFGTADSGVHALLFRIASEEPDLTGLSGELHDMVAACLTKDAAHRPSLEELAKRTEDELAGAWLPGEVLAQLGRHAVQLLDSEDPDTETGAIPVADAAAGTTAAPASSHTPPAPSSAVPAPQGVYGPSTPPPGAYGPPASAPYHPQPQPPHWQQQPGPGAFQQNNGVPAAGPGTPPPPGPGQRRAVSPRKLGNAVTVFLGLSVVSDVIGMFVNSMVSAALEDDGRFEGGSGSLEGVDGFVALKSASVTLEVFDAFVVIPLIVLWTMWFWRARVNAEIFAPGRVRYAAGTAAAAWFLPVANLFIPKQVLNDVWAASNQTPQWYGQGPGPAPRRALVQWWWLLWLCCLFAGVAASYDSWYNMGDLDGAQNILGLVLLAEFVSVPAAVLAIILVNRLTALQDRRISGRL
ncbi:hypothetical protein GCM10012287_49860 [Streptomyces daqingensis]|uniref:Protein kinase domain-containing protein n=1 Tax=Streptomyces daqingensis TaxID=1472640 RepID=A0ABQ2MS09_9ACTN|nr:DUF4328 domain-containing protein [Streptomyces daqingensis]GGO56389.1 hypothetical protein GCM10012287_49860 [Streptomyces daqingensis]